MTTSNSEPSIPSITDQLRVSSRRRSEFSGFISGLAPSARPFSPNPEFLVESSVPGDSSIALALPSTQVSLPVRISDPVVAPSHPAPSENPLDALVRSVSSSPADSFDNPIEALMRSMNEASGGAPQPAGDPPPVSRYMVRVARTGQLHRRTKRNYDYFNELNVALARVEGEVPGGPPTL